MNNSHIALFLPSLAGGGAERVAINLGSGLVAAGYKTKLLVSQSEGPLITQIPRGLEVVSFNRSRVSLCLPNLIRYLNTERPVALISTMDHTNVVAAIAGRFTDASTRIILTVHTPFRYSSIETGGVKECLLRQLVRRTYQWADEVITVSEGVADDLASLGALPRKRIRTISNPIKLPEVSASRKDLDSIPTVIAVGRLTTAKDYPTLLQAFTRVIRSKPSKLVILGEGPERQKIEQLAESLGITNELCMLGFVDDPYPIIASANVLVLSSRWEGFGNVLVEAMAVGTPVVSTNCPGGPAEILDNGLYGPLVPTGDAEALATAILKTLDNPISPEILRHRASKYSINSITREYLKIIYNQANLAPNGHDPMINDRRS